MNSAPAPRLPGHWQENASAGTAATVIQHNVLRTTKLTGWLQPSREPMGAKDYFGATVLTLAGLALAWFAWAGTP